MQVSRLRIALLSAVLGGSAIALVTVPGRAHASGTTLFGSISNMDDRSGDATLDFEFRNPETRALVARSEAKAHIDHGQYIVDLQDANLPPDVYALTVLSAGKAIAPVTFVSLQVTTPGSKEVGNVNISGTLLAGKIGVGTNTPSYPVTVLSTADTTGVWSKTVGKAMVGQSTNSSVGFGGYFSASGLSAKGVYGEATNTGAGLTYGGQFASRSPIGIGAYGSNSSGASSAIGVKGVSSNGYGVVGEATLNGVGIYGKAPINNVGTYGGVFEGDGGTYTTGKAMGTFTTTAAGSGIGLWAQNSALSQDVKICGPDGSVNVGTGQLTRTYSGVVAGTTPVAYAYADVAGNIVTGTSNTSVAYDGGTKIYTITVTGESMSINTYVIVLTSGTYATSFINSSAGKMEVRWKDDTGAFTANDFSYMIYRTGPPLGPQDYPHHKYKSDKEWMQKDPAAAKAFALAHNSFGTPAHDGYRDSGPPRP